MAANNLDGSFRDFEMFGKKFNESGVGLAIVGFGTKIDGKAIVVRLDDFFLAAAGLNGNLVFHRYIIACYN